MKMWSVICGMLQQQASLRTQLIPWLSEPFLTTPEMTDAQTCWHASRHEPKAHGPDQCPDNFRSPQDKLLDKCHTKTKERN